MMKQRVTRRDVALRAGVSETVVSYVLNANRYVDSEKKERVLRAVRELGYFPSPVARALKGKDAHHVLFIVDDMISEYFGSIISEMEKLVAAKAFSFPWPATGETRISCRLCATGLLTVLSSALRP